MEYSEFKTHFREGRSAQLEKFVVETVMKTSRYLFFKQKNGIQHAFCTHCNKTHVPETKLKHKPIDRVICPHCNSSCRPIAAWMGRKYMYDRAAFVWYERSQVDPDSITAKVYSVYWDFSGDLGVIKKKYHCSDEYLFSPGRSLYFHSEKNTKAVYSAFDRFYSGFGNYQKFMSKENIKKAVKGTPFQYSTWEQYTRYENRDYTSDMAEFFDLAARYQCIEYLTKSGFGNFVWAKLYKQNTWGAISWSAKTLLKVLRLSKVEMKEARAIGAPITPKQLRFYQVQRKAGRKFSIAEAVILSDISDGYYEGIYNSFVSLSDETTVLRYLMKQVRNGHYSTATGALSDWRDYREECRQLRMDFKKEQYMFPNNLRAAHSETSKKVKFKKDKKMDQRIRERVRELEATFGFESADLVLRPARSSEELFSEGAYQRICIGSYTDRYASGKLDLFFIRRKAEPDKPFYAVEISEGIVRQCRGKGNCSATEEVQEFMESFKRERLAKKPRSTKSKKAQGVAV